MTQQVRENMPGARKTPGLAVGRSLLPSPDEWAVRNRELTETLSTLINEWAPGISGRAVDVGCQWGVMLDNLATTTALRWWGVDPVIEHHLSHDGWELVRGTADLIPFVDASFDVAVLANVYEHIPPDLRDASLAELHRILVPGGVVVGQLPNPHFPIESHSKLPLMGWLPAAAQDRYWRLSPSRRGAGFHSVTVGDLKRRARAAGFEVALVRNFNYPADAAPDAVRWLVKLMSAPMRVVPWSWQFVLRRPLRAVGEPRDVASVVPDDAIFTGSESLLAAAPGRADDDSLGAELRRLVGSYVAREQDLPETARQVLRRMREAAAPSQIEDRFNIEMDVADRFAELSERAPVGRRTYRGPEWQWLQEAVGLLTKQAGCRTAEPPATRLMMDSFRSRL